MTVTTAHTVTVRPANGGISFGALSRVNLFVTVAAAVAAEALRAAVSASGVHLAVGNPGGSAADVVVLGFGACTIMLAVAMVFGTLLAAVLDRRAARPARTYRITAGILVLVSLVPPLAAAETSAATKVTLVAAHLVAAAIIVPIVGRRLRTVR